MKYKELREIFRYIYNWVEVCRKSDNVTSKDNDKKLMKTHARRIYIPQKGHTPVSLTLINCDCHSNHGQTEELSLSSNGNRSILSEHLDTSITTITHIKKSVQRIFH